MKKIAAVEPVKDADGKADGRFNITAKGTGSTSVKFYAADGSNKTVSVKVNVKLHPDTVLVEKEALLLTAGSSGKMSAKVYPEKAAEKGVTWKFKDDKAVAGFSLDAQTGKIKIERYNSGYDRRVGRGVKRRRHSVGQYLHGDRGRYESK